MRLKAGRNRSIHCHRIHVTHTQTSIINYRVWNTNVLCRKHTAWRLTEKTHEAENSKWIYFTKWMRTSYSQTFQNCTPLLTDIFHKTHNIFEKDAITLASLAAQQHLAFLGQWENRQPRRRNVSTGKRTKSTEPLLRGSSKAQARPAEKAAARVIRSLQKWSEYSLGHRGKPYPLTKIYCQVFPLGAKCQYLWQQQKWRDKK